MSDLFVTYCSTKRNRYGPSRGDDPKLLLEKGSDVRTEKIAIDTVAETGLLEADQYDDVVSVYAEAAAWFVIGDDDTTTLTPGEPESDGVSGSRYIASGERLQFLVSPGEKVAVIAA